MKSEEFAKLEKGDLVRFNYADGEVWSGSVVSATKNFTWVQWDGQTKFKYLHSAPAVNFIEKEKA